MPLARARAFLLQGWRKPTPVLVPARVLGRAEWNLWGSFIPALKGTWEARERRETLDLSLSNLLISPYFGTTVGDTSRSPPLEKEITLSRSPLPSLTRVCAPFPSPIRKRIVHHARVTRRSLTSPTNRTARIFMLPVEKFLNPPNRW